MRTARNGRADAVDAMIAVLESEGRTVADH